MDITSEKDIEIVADNPGPSSSSAFKANQLHDKAGPSGSHASFSTVGKKGAFVPLTDDMILVANSKQKNNPLIKHIKAVQVSYSDDIEADFVFGRGACGIFLSLKYHNLYPNYIYDKMKVVGSGYPLKVLILLVDIMDIRLPLKEITRFANSSDTTLMICYSYEEAAKYVETYKLYRNSSPAILMEKSGTNNSGTEGAYECVAEALSSLKRINRTDAVSTISTFSNMERIVKASPEQLSVVPGMGPQKARYLYSFLRRQFKRSWRHPSMRTFSFWTNKTHRFQTVPCTASH